MKKSQKQPLKIFPLPMSKDQKPLPSIDDLAKRTGTPANGERLFRKRGDLLKLPYREGIRQKT
jgi:hypothetical protein